VNVNDILTQLRRERSRLDQAISALQGLDSTASVAAGRRGWPPGKSVQSQPRGRRLMSAAARAKIAAAQRARWAKQKGTAAAKGSARNTASPAKASPAHVGCGSQAYLRGSEGDVGGEEEGCKVVVLYYGAGIRVGHGSAALSLPRNTV
jgi:hypothetical protein